MLSEDRRKELDTIIQDMMNHKENDSNIRFVVDDFKKKYDEEIIVADKSGVLQKTSRILGTIFGGEKIGETIGTGIAKSGLAGIVGGEKLTGEEKQFVSPAPSATEVVADIAGIGLGIIGLRGVGGGFATRLLKTMGLGAGLAGAEAIEEGARPEEIAKSTALGGLVGGALPVAGKGLQFIGQQIEQLPARFVNSALGRTKAQVLQDISKDRVDDFSKYVVASKPIGSAKNLLNESVENIEQLSSKINISLASAVRKTGKKITLGKNNLLDEITKLPEAEGALLKRIDVQAIIERLAPQTKKLLQQSSLTLEEANKLRQLVDRTLGDRAFLGGQLSSDKIILKSFANTLRNTVKDKAPEGTREIFSELTNEIRFRDGLLSKIAQRAGNQVLTFGDFIGGGLGGIFGGGIGGAIAGVAARRAIESVPFKLGMAKLTSAVTKLEPIINQLAPAQQTAILDFFADIFSPDNHEEVQQK